MTRRRRRRRRRRSSGSRKSSRNTKSPSPGRPHRIPVGRWCLCGAQAGKETVMNTLTRRSVLHGSAALAAASLARPYLANAAATTATVWWVQGFAQEEDVSFKKIVANYEKASGNTIDYSLV